MAVAPPLQAIYLPMASPPLSLTGRALRLLSAREHSRAELERKLAPFDEPPGALAKVLDTLAAKDFINEDRVLASVLYRRSAKLGTARIKHELQSKGLAPEAVAQAVSDLKTSEPERAFAVWSKKFGAPATTPTERAKQVRFLASRGFGGEAIARVVSGAFDADEA
jgi:regulatory protein